MSMEDSEELGGLLRLIFEAKTGGRPLVIWYVPGDISYRAGFLVHRMAFDPIPLFLPVEGLSLTQTLENLLARAKE